MRKDLKPIVFAVLAMVFSNHVWAFDPDNPKYDPAQFNNVGAKTVGFTHVSTSLIEGTGLKMMAGLIEPAQDGKTGGGDSLMLNPTQALALVGALRKGPEWNEVASTVEHHVVTMLEDQPAANPVGDAEKDKLFQ